MQSLLTSAGYAALILFGFLEAACVPIPSEITFGFAGVLAYQGQLNLALVIVIGSPIGCPVAPSQNWASPPSVVVRMSAPSGLNTPSKTPP